jgi:molybdopterin molybdotransferase
MTTLDEALRIIRDHAIVGSETVSTEVRRAAGLVLAEDVASDMDMPAFDRAMMDGFAYRHRDVATHETMHIVATVAAGEEFTGDLAPGECVRIMTGAPVPSDADTVIPVEETREEGDRVRFEAPPPEGHHISPRGEDLVTGAVVLREGQLLGSAEVGVLAAVGRRSVRVYGPPRVAYLSTGDELLEPGEPLRPGMIRSSNSSAVHAQILALRALPHDLGIARDVEDDLREKIGRGLEHDMLLLSGGVSRGRYDLVPDVLEKLGVQLLFHRLLVKPGHPTLFGVRDRALVYGLPGNPIAALFAFELYAAPAIRAFMRHPRPSTTRYLGELTESITKRPGKETLVPCFTEWRDAGFLVRPIRTHGSADIFGMTGANAIAILPADVGHFEAGRPVPFCRLGESEGGFSRKETR